MADSLLRTNKEIGDIYEKYVDTVYRIAVMMLKNIEEAQDVTQTVFMKLITSEKQFEKDEHMKAWLIVVTQNTCKNLLKGWWWAKKTDSSAAFEEAYTLDSTESELWDMLLALPEKLRLPLYLHYYEGYKTEEIASILQIKHATVRTRLWNARKKLKILLEEGS